MMFNAFLEKSSRKSQKNIAIFIVLKMKVTKTERQ